MNTPGPHPDADPRNTLRIGDLELSLEESRRILSAVRTGAVDALVVTTGDGERIFTLQGADDSYRLLIERMSEGALLLTPEGDILYCNERFAQLVGLPLDTVWGQTLDGYVVEEDRDAYQTLLDRGRSGEGRIELRFRDGGGSLHPVLMSVYRVDMHGMALLGAVVTDIAERLRLEEALRQSERLAAIGQVMTGLSHESRNALQRSLASLELLQRRLRDQPPHVLRLLQEAQQAQQDLQRVYEDVQTYAAPIVLDVKEQDVAHCWREAWADVSKTWTGGEAALHEHIDATDARCVVDGFRLRQVFRNLFENALAACPSPVSVQVACAADTIEGAPALCVRVRDNGPGVPPEKVAHIFQPFFTTKTKGTGLGLSIVRRIVEAHGGTVEAAHANGHGLELVLHLPKSTPAGPAGVHGRGGAA